MSTTENQHPVETLSAGGPDEPLGEGIGCPCRVADDPDPFGPEDFVEARGELGVPGTDEEPDRTAPSSSAMVRYLACWTTQEPVG